MASLSLSATKKEALELKNLGNQHYQKGVLDEAYRCYSQAVALDPSESVYLSNRSACLYELGR